MAHGRELALARQLGKVLMVEEEPDIERVGLGHSTRGRKNSKYKGSKWGMNLECWRNRQLDLWLGQRAREIRLKSRAMKKGWKP